MKPRSYTSEGIVLARKNYGEADRILSLYSLQFGRISLIARESGGPKVKRGDMLKFLAILTFKRLPGMV